MQTTGSCPTTHCTIDQADYQNGEWDIRATITTPQGNQTKSYRVDGPENMSYAAIQGAVIELFNFDTVTVT